MVAEPASIAVKKVDGSSGGTATLSLRVADEETAKGLVHRYLVMVRQNARRVSSLVSIFLGPQTTGLSFVLNHRAIGHCEHTDSI